jgi:N-acetylglucosaminyldiphosphoundecaprenol N-acetyl-beta-D-mannosaminyltransferase
MIHTSENELDTLVEVEPPSDLLRSVYCILGMPIDAINIETIVRRVEAAAAKRASYLISTPNLNFLVSSLADPEFRETLLFSDLCSADGAPIIWIAWLLGLPIKERAAGSDLLNHLQALGKSRRRLTVFLFGGGKGVAEAAAKTLNAQPYGLNCVGTLDPGFCEVNEMSQDHIIERVNSSGADFLSVSLGAKKGQQWLYRNHTRLTIPIRVHLGAAINFQAGIIKRAPQKVRALGLEWLWRIKEEPYLWRRYFKDGIVMLRLLFTRVLPLVVAQHWYRPRPGNQIDGLSIKTKKNGRSFLLDLDGVATERDIQKSVTCFREAAGANQDIIIDLSNTRFIDARFFGLMLMLRKQQKKQGTKLTFIGVSRPIGRLFRLNELSFLLAPDVNM